MVAWVHVGRQMLLTIHKHVVVKIPRFSVSHDNQKTWLLHINGVQQDDRGYYMCQVNTNPMMSQVGFLQVVVPPNILDSLSTESTVAVRENQNITLTCKADGYPTPKLMWKREDGQGISINRHKKGQSMLVNKLTGQRSQSVTLRVILGTMLLRCTSRFKAWRNPTSLSSFGKSKELWSLEEMRVEFHLLLAIIQYRTTGVKLQIELSKSKTIAINVLNSVELVPLDYFKSEVACNPAEIVHLADYLG
ncbi:lachesin-like isoform X1 [Vespula squamosa]|uniref:Lachesin-like isoform X1 n=1 Tax=Vespula squamosa TaxID=30214 RepID=A0ABD2ATS4_VESSQ